MMMIKGILIGCVFLSLFASCDVRRHDAVADNNKLKQQVEIKDPTTVQIIDSAYDFGTVTEGAIVEYSYRFKNSGTKPLVITDATSTCGCTVPERPEAPIKPGETGFIKVKFNSEHKVGNVRKPITITSNAEPAFPELQLTGIVNEKKDN